MHINNPRKRMRLEGYDYKQGWFFITICTLNKEKLFGQIKNKQMLLNEAGRIVQTCWNDLPNHYKNCTLDTFIIMPNHIHGIITIDEVGNGFKPFQKEEIPFKNHGLPEVMRGFKTFSSKKINAKITSNKFQWQKSYYDKIIHNEKALYAIRQYIIDNPKNWDKDEMY